MTLDFSLGDVTMIAIQIASFAYMFGVHKTKIETLEDGHKTLAADIRELQKERRKAS